MIKKRPIKICRTIPEVECPGGLQVVEIQMYAKCVKYTEDISVYKSHLLTRHFQVYLNQEVELENLVFFFFLVFKTKY